MAKYNSALREHAAPFLERLQTPQLPEKSGGCFVLKLGEFAVQETPPEEIENDEETSSKMEEIKHRPKWLRGLIYISNKLFYALLHVFVFFVNRGLFALKALGSFNVILLIFVFVEWWFYHALVTEIIPNYFNKTPNLSPPNLTES